MLAFRPAESVLKYHLRPWWAPCTSESAKLPVVAEKTTTGKEQREETPASQMCSLHWARLSKLGPQQETWNEERKSSNRRETEISLCPSAGNTQGETFRSIILMNIDYEHAGPYQT